MQESTSKEKVLKRIRKALIQKTSIDSSDVDFDSEIYTKTEDPLEITFAQNFSAINGKFVFCEDVNEFIANIALLIKENNWTTIFCLENSIKEILRKGEIQFSDNQRDFLATDIGITLCEYLIARTGSVLVSSKQHSGRRLVVYPNIHIVVAYTSQLVFNIKDALKGIRSKYGTQLPSMISTISGPSRTADIEKTLVQGAHGPKEIFVFLIDDTILKEC